MHYCITFRRAKFPIRYDVFLYRTILITVIIEERKLKLAGKVLRDYFVTLSEILAAPSNLSTVIMSLYAKELITDAISTECMNTGRPVQDRCALLLFALQSTVTTQPQSMSTLMEVLKEKEAFKDIAEKMDLQMSLNLYTTN